MMLSWVGYVLDVLCILYYGIVTLLYNLYLGIKRGPAVFRVKNRDRPAVLDNAGLGTHHRVKLKDVTLHYVTKGDTNQQLILFIHGFPDFWFSWREQIKDFSKDYWVVAVDMRGYGDSEATKGIETYRIRHLVDDIKQLIQYLGRDSCVMVGHDWGGIVAFSFAAMHPEMVDSLVVCNAPTIQAWRNLVNTSVEQRKLSWYVFMFQWPLLPEIAFRREDLARFDALFNQIRENQKGQEDQLSTEEATDVTAAYKYTFRNLRSVTGPMNYYRALLRHPPEPEYLAVVKPRSLVVWGTADHALSVQVAKDSVAMCINADIEFIMGAGHFVHQERPREVNATIRKFLNAK